MRGLDNIIYWIDWSITSELTALLEFNAQKLLPMHTAATIPLHEEFCIKSNLMIH